MSDALSALDRLVLYWMWDERGPEWGVPLFWLRTDLEPNFTGRPSIERDCFAVGISIPPYEEALGTLEKLVAGRYFEPLGVDLRDPEVDHYATYLTMKTRGRREAKAFSDFLESEAGRRKTQEFGRELVERNTAGLSFRVILPAYLPDEIDPLPDLILREEEVATNFGPVVIEEAAAEFSEDYDIPDQRIYEVTLDGITVRVVERQYTSIWAQIAWEWEQGGIRIRLNLSVQEPVPETQAEFKYAVIDDEVREEARKIARSMIEQANN